VRQGPEIEAAIRDRAGGIDDRARLDRAESNPSEVGRIG
jgi:hypothetical protein